jgi:hypothetical protein
MGIYQNAQRENNQHSQTIIQPSLEIGKEDDEHEKEADQVADKVMRMPESKLLLQKMSNSEPVAKMPESRPLLQKMGSAKEEEEEKETSPLSIQKKTDGSSDGVFASKNVEQGIQSTKGEGQGLPANVMQEMGSKMNADFSDVKVHTDEKSVEMNKEVGAKAFTSGNDIYFNQGQYNPASGQGKHLLAHELTHTVQQSGNVKRKIQRAETDTRINTSNLKDTASDINTHVNEILDKARKNNPSNISDMIKDIYSDLGGISSPARTEIEDWVDGFDDTKKYLPSPKDTKYAGTTYGIWSQPFFRILNPSIKVNGILIGSDKLGHFFQQGNEYYEAMTKDKKSASKTEKEIGYDSEAGGYGLDTTGVFSNADLSANKKGSNFYANFAKNPTMKFDISKYLDKQWNEEFNTNFYTPAVASVVWSNLVNKAVKAEMVDINNDNNTWLNTKVSLRAVENQISGTLNYTNPQKENTLISVHGMLSFKQDITDLKAVTGIQVMLNWVSKNKTGQIFLESVKESLLYGSVYKGKGRSKLLGGINIHL